MMQLSGNFTDYFVAFWSGVLVSFTPCVYPVMPLTASFIAGMNTNGSRWKGFLISLIYVFGMAVTYCSLAVLAALTGKAFGQFQANNPVVFGLVAATLIFFALVMFDVVQLPTLALAGPGRSRPKNLWTVLLFGMASGLIVGPCTAPVLGTLLLYVHSKQNVLHGVSLLFFFSYGVGASLILVGTFSGLLAALPRSGGWLVRVKQLCGIILLAAGLYYLLKTGQALGIGAG